MSRLSGPCLALCAVTLAGVFWIGCTQPSLRTVLPADEQVDTFTQTAIPKVDILWVVDNSGTMITKQQELAQNFSTFFQYLQGAGVDFHLALASTDTTPMYAGQLVSAPGQPSVITSATADGAAAFAANVGELGSNGSDLPQGLNAARDVLQLDPPDFLRSDAYLFIIFVSDKDDNSEPADPLFFYRYFAGYKGQGNDQMVLAGAIVATTQSGCFIPPDIEATYGQRYSQTIQLLSGQLGSICDADFTQTLTNLGVEAVGLQDTYALSEIPDPSTIEVTIQYPCGTASSILDAVCTTPPSSTCSGSPSLLSACTMKQDTTAGGTGTGWTYNSKTNAIVFDGEAVPPKGATFEILYYQPGKKPS